MRTCPICHNDVTCEECGTLGQFCFGARPVTPEQVTAFLTVLERRGKPNPTEDAVLAFVNEVGCAFNSLVR